MKDKKQKPTKDPFIKYYIVWPIQGLGEELVSATKWLWRRLSGAWWCDHCETYHGRRVHKYLHTKKVGLHRTGPGVFTEYEDAWVCSIYRDSVLAKKEQSDAALAEKVAEGVHMASEALQECEDLAN